MKYGRWVMTRGINDTVANDENFAKQITSAIARYRNNDWGDLCDEDKQLNDDAVMRNDDRILAAYKTDKGKVYIITEWDRSATTILFANEY